MKIRANQAFRAHFPLWEASGIIDPDITSRKQQLARLWENGDEGRRRRLAFQQAIHDTRFEYQGVGIEMNQRYKSEAVYQEDQGPEPPLSLDPVLHYQMTTYPGARLPHAWLNLKVPTKPISTLDLAGKGQFTLFTGIGGDKWRDAAIMVSQKLKVFTAVYSIGFHQDYQDPYFEWARLREVEENGCVLVRPDRFVAWRSMEMVPDAAERLLAVMRTILSIKG